MEERDEKLWQLAKKRASFQRSLVSYVVIILLLWVIWYVTQGQHSSQWGTPWPIWAMLGWGIGLIFQFLGAYVTPKTDLAEKEYEKLKNKG